MRRTLAAVFLLCTLTPLNAQLSFRQAIESLVTTSAAINGKNNDKSTRNYDTRSLSQNSQHFLKIASNVLPSSAMPQLTNFFTRWEPLVIQQTPTPTPTPIPTPDTNIPASLPADSIAKAIPQKKENLPDCTRVSDLTPWTGPWGSCTAYANSWNRYFCDIDAGSDGLTASQACYQCLKCNEIHVPQVPTFSPVFSYTNAAVNTITISFGEQVSGFSMVDLQFDAGGTGANLYSLRALVNGNWIVSIDNAVNKGVYSLSMAPNAAIYTQRDGLLFARAQPVSVTIDYCDSHSDCLDGQFCMDCNKCYSRYPFTSLCKPCDTTAHGMCTPLASCTNSTILGPSVSIDNTCPVVANPCACASNGVSGGDYTYVSGCRARYLKHSPICYVTDPAHCPTASRDISYSFAAWRYCDDANYTVSLTDCYNGVAVKALNGTYQYYCDGMPVYKTEFDTWNATSPSARKYLTCVRIARPGATCLCYPDFQGESCGVRRSLYCTMNKTEICTGPTRDMLSKEYVQYDSRINGLPVCNARRCSTDTHNVSAVVQCQLQGSQMASADFKATYGVSDSDYAQAETTINSQLILNSPNLALTSDPRVYSLVGVIDFSSMMSTSQLIGTGLRVSSLDSRSSNFLASLPLYRLNATAISGGRVYIETTLGSYYSALTSRSLSTVVDCSDFSVKTVDPGLSSGELAAIIVFVVVGVSVLCLGVLRYRLIKERKEKMS